jgi:hypothetical protein
VTKPLADAELAKLAIPLPPGRGRRYRAPDLVYRGMPAGWGSGALRSAQRGPHVSAHAGSASRCCRHLRGNCGHWAVLRNRLNILAARPRQSLSVQSGPAADVAVTGESSAQCRQAKALQALRTPCRRCLRRAVGVAGAVSSRVLRLQQPRIAERTWAFLEELQRSESTADLLDPKPKRVRERRPTPASKTVLTGRLTGIS